MKKFLSFCLSASLIVSTAFISACTPTLYTDDVPVIQKDEGLRVHAVINSTDTQAWHLWQSVHDEYLKVENPSEKYFFLPSSADEKFADIYNAYSEEVILNGVSIKPDTTEKFEYKVNTPYEVKVKDQIFSLRFMKSNAEAAVFINNQSAGGNGTDLFSYLNDENNNADKSLSAAASGAIIDSDGNIDNTPITKIKGRGNTSWDKSKKSYNVTYENDVSVAGMKKGKKYSLLANYQDDSLSRNRFLYDLADAVDVPYASDSRYTDLYINGFYCGSYQMCEKVAAGKNSLVNDISTISYLNANGSVKKDFPFLCEADPGINKDKDYFVETDGGYVVIKYPELKKDDKGYEQVKEYVAEKYNAFFNAASSKKDLSSVGDIDSLSKLYLINELGKNWDSGVSSTYFVYKPDASGKYKFFGSPVWDYDNALGNATGVEEELEYFNIKDYEQYTGWWCRYKGGSDNIINRLSQNPEILNSSKTIWFDKFVPAINHFSGESKSEKLNAELYTSEKYYSLIKDSAEMNYKSGWLLNTGDWIADHSSLTKATFDTKTKKMITDQKAASYNSDFTGMYNYCRDWTISRAAWLSQEFSK